MDELLGRKKKFKAMNEEVQNVTPGDDAAHFVRAWAAAQQEVPYWDRPKRIPLEVEGRDEQQDTELGSSIFGSANIEHNILLLFHSCALRRG